MRRIQLAMIWIVLGIFARLIPHPPNVTPLTNLCLFAGSQLSRKLAFVLTFVLLAVSDISLSFFYGYPIFGSWTIFTYSGFAILILAGRYLPLKAWQHTTFYILASSVGFWLWTNFGAWLLSGLYLRTIQGLITCYIAALPFLRYAILGDIGWMIIIFGTFKFFSADRKTKILPTYSKFEK